MLEQEQRKEAPMDLHSLMIIEELLRNPKSSYKDIAKKLKVDQRTVARKIEKLEEENVIKPSLEIDWKKLGLDVSAFVGLTTAKTPRASSVLNEIIMKDPRVVEAYETLGTTQFFIRIMGKDMFSLRDSILREIDPLAGDLTTSLVTMTIKPQDYRSLVRHLRETWYPRTRTDSD